MKKSENDGGGWCRPSLQQDTSIIENNLELIIVVCCIPVVIFALAGLLQNSLAEGILAIGGTIIVVIVLIVFWSSAYEQKIQGEAKVKSDILLDYINKLPAFVNLNINSSKQILNDYILLNLNNQYSLFRVVERPQALKIFLVRINDTTYQGIVTWSTDSKTEESKITIQGDKEAIMYEVEPPLQLLYEMYPNETESYCTTGIVVWF